MRATPLLSGMVRLILSLLAAYPWKFAQVRVELSRNASAPTTEWRYAYDLPARKTDMVGEPLKVYASTALNPPVFFEYEIDGNQLLTNAEVIVIEHVQRKAESLWPGHFVPLAVEACAAQFALPVTENASKEELHTIKARGNTSEGGMGGLMGQATSADERGTPAQGLLDDHDPMTIARFGAL